MKKICILLFALVLLLSSVTAYASNGLVEGVSSDGIELVYIPDLGGKVTIYLNGQKLDLGMDLDWFMTKDNFSFDFPETLIPIRAVCEAIGYEVDWVGTERIIYIRDKETEKTISIDPKTTHHIVNIDGHYYLDFTKLMEELGLKNEGKWFNTLSIYKTMPLTDEEKAVTPPEHDEYPAGIYKVGVDIPSGNYILFPNDERAACVLSTYILPSAPHSIDYLLENPMVPFETIGGIKGSTQFLNRLKANVKIFSTSFIVSLSDGEFFEMSSCSAVPLTEEPITSETQKFYVDGAYRVGTDIPQGEYVLIKTGEKPMYDTRSLNVMNFGKSEGQSIPFEHTIIRLKYERFIYLENCVMYSLGSEPDITQGGDLISNGAYKVSTHLKVGAYLVKPDGSGNKMNVSPINGSMPPDMSDKGEFYIFLEPDDILYLENAVLDLSSWKNYKKTISFYGDIFLVWYEIIDYGTEPVIVESES